MRTQRAARLRQARCQGVIQLLSRRTPLEKQRVLRALRAASGPARARFRPLFAARHKGKVRGRFEKRRGGRGARSGVSAVGSHRARIQTPPHSPGGKWRRRGDTARGDLGLLFVLLSFAAEWLTSFVAPPPFVHVEGMRVHAVPRSMGLRRVPLRGAAVRQRSATPQTPSPPRVAHCDGCV